MDKVIKLVPPEPPPVAHAVVEVIEEALTAAKEGDITSVVILGITRESDCRVMVSWSRGMFEMVGMLESVKAQTVAAMGREDED